MIRAVSASILAVTLAGCVSNNSLYEWGSYQHDLLAYSKNPGEGKKFASSLSMDIQKAEKAHKVPPGLYAEYGYTLLDSGDSRGAVEYFTKERDHWPESAALMNKLIKRLAATEVSKPTNNGGAGQ